tara:strand:+ start:116 stop:1510 length:1395 start_codon:yes stop_codon:yes gene_type:complete
LLGVHLKSPINKSFLQDFYISFVCTVLLAASQIILDANVQYLAPFYLFFGGLLLYVSFIKYQNVVSIKSLFLIGNFFVFSVPLIYISIFSNGEWVSYKFSPEIINSEHIKVISLLVGVGVTSFLFGYILPSPNREYTNQQSSKYMFGILLALAFSFLVIIYRRYELLNFVSEHGFEAIYSKGYSSSFIEAILAYVFIVLAPVAYLLSKSDRIRKVILFLILLEAILHGLAGQRVWILTGIIQVLFLVTLNSRVALNDNILKRIKLVFYLTIAAVISVYIMAAMLFYREGESFNIFTFSILDYFIGQFGTIIGLKITLDNPEFVYGSYLPPLFDTLNPFRSSVQGFISNETANIGSRVTYLSCASCLEQGKSYGSSIYAQLYQFGFIGVSIGCLLFGYIAKLIDTRKCDSYVYALLGFFLAKHYLWSSRGEFFPHYINIFVILLSLAALHLLMSSYQRGYNERGN